MNSKAALYLRVSTDAQSEKYSIPAQKEMLKKYCEIKEYTQTEVYTDAGFSGSNLSRPALSRLCEDAREGKIQTVLVYKLDRLSRSQKDTLYLIEEVFLPCGVDFISISENFDTSTPFGKAMIGILSVFAQLERETIRERTRMGMLERVKKGYWPGGGKLPYGYDYDKEKGILVKNAHAPAVSRMYEMYLSGYSAETIARKSGIKYDRVVMQILKSPINMGWLSYGGKIYKGVHEPIVNQKTFESVKEQIAQRSRGRISGGDYLLSGLIYCGKCGAKMRYQKWGKNGHKLCCYSQQSTKDYLIKDKNCDNKKIWAYEVEQALINQLFRFSLDEELLQSYCKKKTEVKSFSAEKFALNELTDKIEKLIAFLSENIAVEDIKKQLEVLCKRRDALRIRLKEEEISASHREMLIGKVKNLSGVWDKMDFSQKRAIITTLVEKIVITDDRADIFYRFE